jgi:hypothetical protein
LYSRCRANTVVEYIGEVANMASTEYMTAEQASEAAKELTFKDVWAALMELKESQRETDRQMKESRMETDRQMKESRLETDRQMKESRLETDRQMKELKKSMDESQQRIEKNLGGLGNTLGQISEATLSAELWKKFRDLGFPVTRQSTRMKFLDEDGRVQTEADLFIENGDCVILAEIKSNMKNDYVDDHLERMEIVRKHFDGRGDNRKLIGAVAAAVMPDGVLKYAQKNGFYVAVLSGDAVTLAEMPHGFKAREW